MADILVTGSTGFVGSAVVEELESRGNRVRRASRTSSDIQVDLTSPREVRKLPDVDIVVNAAGTGDINGLEKDKEDWNRLNIGSIENLAERYTDVHFIHISSLAAAGLEGSYYRDAGLEPVLPYSKSKKEAEDAVRENFETFTVVRPGEVFDEENIPTMLRFFSALNLAPRNRSKTPAIRIADLTRIVKSAVEGELESPVIAAREYEPFEILQEADRLSSKAYRITIPNFVIGYAGYIGELLRVIGFRVPGLVRARSIMSYQKIEQQSRVKSILED